MAVRAPLLFGSRLWAAGANANMMCSNAPTRCLSLFSRTSSATATADMTSPTATTSSSSKEDAVKEVFVASDGVAEGLDSDDEALLRADAADRIARAAAALDDRALRSGFMPSQADVHLDTASRFGGPGVSAMNDMVAAVYSACAGDGKTVERRVEHLTAGTAGVPRRPLTTLWSRSAAASAQEDEEEAAAIRETLTAYRFAGVSPRAITPEPEAPAAAAAAAAAAAEPADAAPTASAEVAAPGAAN